MTVVKKNFILMYFQIIIIKGDRIEWLNLTDLVQDRNKWRSNVK